MSGRPKTFLIYHKYMKDKLIEIDKILGEKEIRLDFPKVIDDVKTIVHGPLRVVTTRLTIWIQGKYFR
jgi:hypothetical protein